MEKLGLDIPPAPELVLEEILPQQIRVSWKQPELSNSIYKHVIYINGQRGELGSLCWHFLTAQLATPNEPRPAHPFRT